MSDLFCLLAQTTAPAPDLVTAYAQLRTPLITSSAAVAALSVSIASFVFARVKESVYDSEEYVELVRERRFFNPRYSTHGPLDRWFWILWGTVSVATVSVIAHFTLGALPMRWAVIVCLVLSSLTAIMLAMVIVSTWHNVRAWVRWSSVKAERRIAASPVSSRTA